MSSLDNAAATNAQNLLNGIDYGAIIGGPLQAAIKAQAMAAQSTWEFIQQVGMNTDANGNKTAVNVSFTYISGGRQVKLIVPILTIVPIPAIEITEIDIAFKASINASASQSSEQSDSSALAGQLSATGQVGWGPFSLSASMSASYSSKKDSKATQDSKYSVEYTQDVAVKAAQAGMPAGLATILNILSNAATAVPQGSELTVTPAAGTIAFDDLTQQQQVQIKVTDSNGVAQANLPVSLSYTGGDPTVAQAIMFGSGALPQNNAAALSTLTGSAQPLTTGNDGTVLLTLWFDASQLPVAGSSSALTGNFTLEIQATVEGALQQFALPFSITGSAQPQLSASPSAMALSQANGGNVVVTVLNAEGNPMSGVTVTATGGTLLDTSGLASSTLTAADGTLTVPVKWASGQTAAATSLSLSIPGYGQTVSVTVPVTPAP